MNRMDSERIPKLSILFKPIGRGKKTFTEEKKVFRSQTLSAKTECESVDLSRKLFMMLLKMINSMNKSYTRKSSEIIFKLATRPGFARVINILQVPTCFVCRRMPSI